MATRTTISLLELGPVIFGGIDGIISFLQGKGLLAQQKTRCAQLNSCKHQFCWEGLVLLSKLTNHFFGTNLK